MTNKSQDSSLYMSQKQHDKSTSRLLTTRVLADAQKHWPQDKDADVAELLKQHPELKLQKTLVLGLAHDEYCRRIESGDAVDVSDFCRQFPSFQNSLYMAIELDRLLSKDSAFQALCNEQEWPKSGEYFLGYSLIGELGCGSFAHVYLASETALGDRIVVLKVAPYGGKEAEIIGKLRHPNIVPIHSIKEDPETKLTAICMPYLGRTTLCDILDYIFVSEKIPDQPDVICQAISELNDDPKLLEAPGFDSALRRGSYVDAIIHLASQIADALSYTHDRCIYHLDIKPSNVLLSIEGKPLLLDFNLSIDDKMEAWKIGGTLPYMSPEQLREVVDSGQHKPLLPDPRSDLFSLGIVIYQLLSGELPFGPIPKDSNIEELAENLISQQKQGPLPLQEKNPRIDQGVAALVESCLAFDPEKRPQSASILAKSLRKQLSPRRRVWRWIRNNPRYVLSATVVLLALACLGGLIVALQPPYEVRQLQRGQYYAKQGQYRRAVEYFNSAVESKPGDPDILFVRGRARQKLGQYDSAAVDFRDALRLKPDEQLTTRLYACQGLCSSKMGLHVNAELFYRKAMEAGMLSPGLCNNLGNVYLKQNHFDKAEQYLKKAIAMAPNMQAAHNNLLLLHVQRSCQGEPISESVLMHAIDTVDRAPPSGILYQLAAHLFSEAGKKDSQWIPLAKKYTRLAIKNHVNPQQFAIAKTSYLNDDPEIQNLINRSDSKKPMVKPEWLADPLDNI